MLLCADKKISSKDESGSPFLELGHESGAGPLVTTFRLVCEGITTRVGFGQNRQYEGGPSGN
jgi:hypothetical protein